MSWRNHQKVVDGEAMSNLKSQISKLKGELEKYNKSLEVIVFDNGEELKFRGREIFDALHCAHTSDYENRIVKGLKAHQFVSYSGCGNMPQLIKSLLNSKALHGIR